MYYDTINSDNPIFITCLLVAQFLSGSPQEILHPICRRFFAHVVLTIFIIYKYKNQTLIRWNRDSGLTILKATS